jgi:hypothetical protein
MYFLVVAYIALQVCHFATGLASLAPVTTVDQRAIAHATMQKVFGDPVEGSASWERREAARASSTQDGLQLELPQHETVYGELGIDALAKVLDAVGVGKGDTFLDIGSGDGMLVMGASLLWPEHFKSCVGLEILPSLYERSLAFQPQFQQMVDKDGIPSCPIKFQLGNVYDVLTTDADDYDRKLLKDIVKQTTVAVCFATTWSRGIPGQRLDRLSKALGSAMRPDSRVVIIDGRLDCEDGFEYEGELKIYCPDTAPYSTARLYTKQ